MDPTQQPTTNNKSPFFATLIATGFFTGYIPWASGTFGSLAGLLLYLIPGANRPEILCVLIVIGFIIGAISSASVARAVGNQLSASAKAAKITFQGGVHETPDPSIVVIDEIVGVWISLVFLPNSIWVIVLAFVLFRVFDILKPPPAHQLERIPNGWGIMLDDVAAGMYANLSCHLLLLIFPQLV